MLFFNHRSFFAARFMLTLVLLAGLFGIVPVSPVYAATLIVPDNYSTIQAAINAASPGDTISVRPGTYAENLTLSKSVILTAASYTSLDPTRNTTIIDGSRSRSKPAILIPIGISPMPTIRGFIIRNGIDNIKVTSEAIIEYNYFIGSTDQLDYGMGGGGVARRNVFFDSLDDAIDLDNMNRPLLIEHNRLMYNRDDGIEVRLQDATAPLQPITITIRKNEIIGCDEDGIQFIDYGQTVDTRRNYMVTDNLIANCRFAGIGLMGNTISVEDYSGANIVEAIWVYNNTIYGNDYGISGGDNLVAINNIIANSTTKGIWRVQGPVGASSVVAYTLFYNNGVDADQSTLGAGNKFGQNPLFAYAPTPGPDGVWRTVDDDFRGLALLSGSPAIDAGYDPICPGTDLLGVSRPQGAHCDLGAFEGAAAAGPTPPVATSLISPSGSITSTTPAYTWSSVNTATWYYLWVSRVNSDGSLTTVHNKWYDAALVCSGATCSITPAGVTLNIGQYRWWVQTWNDGGYGPWSSAMNFGAGAPDMATLVSPNGAFTDTTPAYTWNAVNTATWYYLWVSKVNDDNSLTTVHTKWYDSSLVCSGATCSITPEGVTLSGGNYKWWIQTWNEGGYGSWSSFTDFSLPVIPLPGAATLVSPFGSTTNTTPAYTWSQVNDATWYYLWVSSVNDDGSLTTIHTKWYDSSLVCSGITCTITPSGVTLSPGNYRWWIQTWNDGGYGPWTGAMNFTVSP